VIAIMLQAGCFAGAAVAAPAPDAVRVMHVFVVATAVNATALGWELLLVLGKIPYFSWMPVIGVFGADAWAVAALTFLFHRTSEGFALAFSPDKDQEGIGIDMDDSEGEGNSVPALAFAEEDDFGQSPRFG
jgi:hypothetical protein